MPLAAVTLDAAGTLFEVAEPVGATYARVAARHGIALDPEETERRFRDVLAVAPPLAFPGVDAPRRAESERSWWQAVVRAAFGPAGGARGFPAAFAELFRTYAEPAAWRVFPDVRDALVRLRRDGLRLAVVSNFDERLIPLLEGLDLASLVDQVTPSSRVGAAKPDPAIFRAALAGLGVSPDATVHVGDGLVADVEGARAAGLRAVLLDRKAPKPRFSPDMSVITALTDLPSWLGAELA
jgi:putative hydrolase of the HAD superfamily